MEKFTKEVKFRKEAAGLFTGDRAQAGENKSGTVTNQNINESIYSAAFVLPDEVKAMMDAFVAWDQNGRQGAPPVAKLAPLYLPEKELERYPGDPAAQRLEKSIQQLAKMRNQLLTAAEELGVTGAVIDPSGQPALTPDAIDQLVRQFEDRAQQLEQAAQNPSSRQTQLQEAAEDAKERAKELRQLRITFVNYNVEAQKFQSQTIDRSRFGWRGILRNPNQQHLRIDATVWMADPKWKRVWLSRAIGADRRAKQLPNMLRNLGSPVTGGLPSAPTPAPTPTPPPTATGPMGMFPPAPPSTP